MKKKFFSYNVRFLEHGKPYRVTAKHEAHAWEIAKGLAGMYSWTVASVGLVIR